MPFGDETGPEGLGPMTGRAAGYCASNPAPGYANPNPGFGVFGRGSGRGNWSGRGRRRGWRNWFYATGIPGWARFGYGYPIIHLYLKLVPKKRRICSKIKLIS